MDHAPKLLGGITRDLGRVCSTRSDRIILMGDNDTATSRVEAEQRYLVWRAAVALERIASIADALLWGLIFACFLYAIYAYVHRGEE